LGRLHSENVFRQSKLDRHKWKRKTFKTKKKCRRIEQRRRILSSLEILELAVLSNSEDLEIM
jgi:hypothetical protein